ncbi:Thiamine-phosphate synthase [Gammaproteobacteria bacterium]
MSNLFRGLYAIADTSLLSTEELVEKVALSLQGDACLVQYRDKKPSSFEQKIWQATDLVHLCRGFQVPLIINDDVELALAVGASGVHLGREDMEVVEARRRLGDSAILGVSCYDDLSLALKAQASGANYVAFGRFFPSQTKPLALQTDPEILKVAKQYLKIPIVAIGGITPANARPLVEMGADMVAVVHGLFGQSNVLAAATQFSKLF